MDISNSFDLPIDPTVAWRTLLDIKRIMPCIPGAELLEASDDGSSYRGKVSVKLGPMALAFVGTAKFVERDDALRRARLHTKGSDAKGRGGVTADMTFQVAAAGAGSQVSVLTQLQLSGAVAQFGRGGGIIQAVAAQLIGEFSANLKTSLASSETAATGGNQPQTRATVSRESPRSPQSGALAVTQETPAGVAKPRPSAVKPVSGFALLWNVLWSRLIGLFGRRG